MQGLVVLDRGGSDSGRTTAQIHGAIKYNEEYNTTERTDNSTLFRLNNLPLARAPYALDSAWRKYLGGGVHQSLLERKVLLQTLTRVTFVLHNKPMGLFAGSCGNSNFPPGITGCA